MASHYLMGIEVYLYQRGKLLEMTVQNDVSILNSNHEFKMVKMINCILCEFHHIFKKKFKQIIVLLQFRQFNS